MFLISDDVHIKVLIILKLLMRVLKTNMLVLENKKRWHPSCKETVDSVVVTLMVSLVNLSVDIAHDLLEGICAYELALIIDKFVFTYRVFTLEHLNSKIKWFPYNLDRTNKPPPISLDHLKNKKIKMTASQMLTFMKNFRFMVGKLCQSFTEWNLYLKLLDIVIYSFSKSFSKALLNTFQTLIEEHHECYIELFGPLKPKHLFHFALC